MPSDEDLDVLNRKLNQLKLEYDKYFLGSRPREPILQRQELQKLVVVYSNQSITNTAQRFRFNSICSRYQALKRQWNETLRKLESGTHQRQQPRGGRRAGGGPAAPDPDRPRPGQERREVYDAYVEARRACGESVDNLTPKKFQALLDKQESALRQRYGAAGVRFKVVVEEGRAKLKASRE